MRLLAAAVSLVLATVGAAATPGSLDVQGHRGCRGLMPENSMPAFRKALELGVTTLELDVQSTADDVLVVHHDPRLDSARCVDADGERVRATPIGRLTWEQLQGIDCGRRGDSKFPRQARVPAPIPRLGQVLSLAREANYPVRLSIEIKLQDSKNLAAREMAVLLVRAVRDHDLVDRTTVQSFSVEALAAVGEIEPGLARAILVRSPQSYDEALKRSGATILSPKYTRLRERDVRRLQQLGILVIPWTVNEPEAIGEMIAWRVDGIISDYPDRVIEILSERDAEPK